MITGRGWWLPCCGENCSGKSAMSIHEPQASYHQLLRISVPVFSLTSPLSSTFANPEDGIFMSAQKYPPLQVSANIKAIITLGEAKEEPCRLVLFTGSPVEFGLKELLMAPSIALGDKLPTFTNTQLVRLRKDILFVVKRFSTNDYSHDKLLEEMKIIGSIDHENVGKMIGYCLHEDECLAIREYFPQESLETMKKAKNRVHLNWEARVRIATGVAKGLAHIHGQRRRGFAHANIKASNIFLDAEQYGCIADDYSFLLPQLSLTIPLRFQ
ncbi:UNVERIFIED_CONTAM: putative inactive receptor kinase [Sesamum latifolium]|uniref:Inactive receptor kinase n=1 Tax=Sesamum latifolium TaxID=2727402 RepID=A0AAW2T7G2_9LAMI